MPTTVSPVLGLPMIQPSQSQKHVTHNEALKLLDVLVHLSLSSRTTATPPVSPIEGQRHLVPDGAAGDWAGETDKLAIWRSGTWTFINPQIGWQGYVQDEDVFITFTAAGWDLTAAQAVHQNLDLVGINNTADLTNRLTVAADATLLTHDGDDHRLKINKAAAGDTASLLFQSGFTGHAEMGLAGSEDFDIRVSADGTTFTTALSIDATTGVPKAPQGFEVSTALTGSAVVGTVSQSGGQTTGAIIERGSNANGHYTRWADGTQICWRNDFQIDGTSASIIHAIWTFPASFATTPVSNLTLPFYSSSWSVASERHNVSSFVASTNSTTLTRIGYFPVTTPVTVTIDDCCVIAMGRWY